MSEVILLDGGLDTASSPLAAKRGGLRACQNYEVGTERGYRRIDGIEIYDGTINPEINNLLRIEFRSECTDGELTSACIGSGVQFPNPYGYLGESVVESFDKQTVGESFLYTLEVRLSKTSTVSLSPKIFDVAGVHVEPTGEFDVLYSLGNARLQSDVNTDSIQPIRFPDKSRTQRVGGLFWRNDKLYAIVDCVKISVTPVIEDDPDLFPYPISAHVPGNGAYMYVGASTTPFGEVLLRARDSFTYVPCSESLPEIGDEISIGDGIAKYTVVSFDYSNASILYVATHGAATGWTRVETNRIASYEQTVDCDASAFFDKYNRFAFSDTALDEVVSSQILVNSVEAEAAYWKDKDNVIDADAAFVEYGWDLLEHPSGSGNYNFWAGLDTVSKPLKCRFDFTGIPRTARVVGIQVNIKKRMPANPYSNNGNSNAAIVIQPTVDNIIYDDEIKLFGTGIVSENKALASVWPTVTTEFQYGNDQDMWGSNISLTDMLSEDFFLSISARNGLTIPLFKAFEISYVEMLVHYITQSNDVYIYRADVLPGDGINRKVVIPHRTVQSGLPATKTAKGQIVIEGLDKDVIESGTYHDAVGRGYITAPGDQLRTAISGGGSLIAVLTTADGPQYLPSSWELTDVNKRWHAVQASPYSQDNSDISIICNGVTNAYVWDDRNLLPVATGLDAKYEKPSFSAYWGGALVLGYDTGTLIFSDIGDPLSFVGGAEGAAEIDVSDKVTGILALKGEALGIFTEKTIQALYGDDVTNLSRKIISPNSGAIPYTVCDMGVPVFTDFRGIGTVDAVQEYGDFQRGRWSYNIQNYITPLIQNESKFLGNPSKVLCAYPVRNKNQYRLCFSDASVITMTLFGSGLDQQFTTQSIYTRTAEGEKVLMPLLAHAHGVSSAGRDVIFCSLDSGFHDGYVFRIDQGNKFPSIEADNVGVEIEAFIDLNYNHSTDRPSATTRIDRLAVYGLCKGYATLGFNQSVFYGDPGEYTVAFTAGDILATADKPSKYFMSVVNSGCEARDISFRISSNELEASHTLQAIEVFSTESGQRKDDKK